jgi:hypothetical protein
MEQIIRRGVIAICVIGVALGGPMLFLGWRAVEVNLPAYLEASAKRGDALDACRARTEISDEGCWSQWRLDVEQAEVYDMNMRRGGELQVMGIVIGIVIPVTTLTAFLLFRWIITGRWRSPARSVRATHIPKDSA